MSDIDKLSPEDRKRLEKYLRVAKKGFVGEPCPFCGKTVTGKRHVGRCTYAQPCGCRLGQGRF